MSQIIDSLIELMALMIASIRQPKRNPHHVLLQLVLNDLQDEPSAWPFIKPVDSHTVRDYYEVITKPMGTCEIPRVLAADLVCRPIDNGI